MATLDLTDFLTEDQIVTRDSSDAASRDPIFTTYLKSTLKKLDDSISDAEGRYVTGPALERPAPSPCFRVKRKLAHAEGSAASGDETCVVFVKVGISKLTVNPAGATEKQKEEIEVYAKALPSLLKSVRKSIADLEAEHEQGMLSDFGKKFHEIAIAEAKPKTFPLKDEHIAAGLNGWEHDENDDRYYPAAVTLSAEDEAKYKKAVAKKQAKKKKK